MGTTTAIITNAIPWNNKIRALCDTGSQANLITKRAVQRLGLKTSPAHLPLTGTQETIMTSSTAKVTLHIQLCSNQVIHSTFHVVKRVICDLPVIKPDTGRPSEFKDLQLADPHYLIPSEVDALFGLPIWIRIVSPKLVKSADGNAIAQQTKLGYVVFQSPITHIHTQAKARIAITQAGPVQQPDQCLAHILQQFWTLEDVPHIQALSPDEQRCEQFFVSTHSRDNEGRYIVKMPFNNKIKLLGRSKSIALKQLFSMERKMKMKPQFAQDYRKYMEEFEAQGYMSRIQETAESGYYTPHHGVYGASKDKIRIVYNASCSTSTGISLNECQYTGAKLQDDLAVILMRFRTHKVGITADIKAMYCQVGVHKDHRKYQKILWRPSTDQPVGVYQLNRVAFGQTAAPFLAIRAMRQCADDHEQEYSTRAKEVRSSFYVDDLLTGAERAGQARTMAKQITSILAYGKFELAKWCSNDPGVNRSIQGTATEVEIKDPEMKGVLGLIWSAATDELMYKLRSDQHTAIWTKRTILSEIGKLYDPNGFISPIVITAKILIQAIWKTQTGWDEAVTAPILKAWETFKKEIPDVQSIRIPRWLGTSKHAPIQLHGFSDASQDAYACCVYARTVHLDGHITVELIQSKTRVAPLKTQSIPRLELCGAHILAKLLKTILNSIQLQIAHSFCWTDSEVVLQWLHKSPSELKTFVANRVAYIQENTHEQAIPWNWVAGIENPADIASRGMSPSQLANNDLWWKGPSWLTLPEEQWPKPRNIIDSNTANEEVKIVSMVAVVTPTLKKRDNHTKTEFDIFEAYTNFLTLWHVVAYILRAASNFKRKRDKYERGPLSDEELEEARLTIVRNHQAKYFKAELEELTNPDKRKRINHDLSMWYDTQTRTLRLLGRVITDNLTFNQKFPIIISHRGRLATLLMDHAHRMGHGGAQQMLQFIRQQYWITKARQLAQSIIHKCRNCRRHHIHTATTLMAALPAERTTSLRAFKQCGVDYLGPINIASRTGRNPPISRGYVSVFICMVTRAIHLEIVNNGTKEAFIQALRRIISRRGAIKQMWSDNGTTFVGANNYLRSIGDQHEQWAPDIEHTFHLQWKFIVPRAPSWGGIWEAAVKSVKRHITRIVGDRNLTYEEWTTLLAQIEAWVNSRPLVPLTDDPTDMVALTPAHFLIGEALTALPEPDNLIDTPENRLVRWQLIQKLNQEIWKRWHTEYLTSLIDRTKWKTQTRNFRVNDLVLIKEDNMPPNKWHMGRITKVLPSGDGIVRAVTVRTSTGEYNRPILKLALLMEDPDTDEQNTQQPKQPVAARINVNLRNAYFKLVSKHQ